MTTTTQAAMEYALPCEHTPKPFALSRTTQQQKNQIASAIKTISPDEKDSFRSRQLERLLAIKEKEASGPDGGGGGGRGE